MDSYIAINDPRLDEKKLLVGIQSNIEHNACIKLGKEGLTENAMLQRQKCETKSKWLCQTLKGKGISFMYEFTLPS